jgi:hypothetical protein
MSDVNTIRWGDRITHNAGIGEQILTPDVFRVMTAPFPTVWRVIGVVESGDPALFVNFILDVGIGSVVKPYAFAIPINSTFSFEVPAHTVAGRFQTGVFAVATQVLFDASVAPLAPWQGLEVHVARK